jgi:hypothetical protein
MIQRCRREISQSNLWPRAGGHTVLLLALALLFSAGCTRIHTEKGIEPVWHDVEVGSFQVGVTTQSDVMALIGPPSQIISHQNGSIFYYLYEEAIGNGLILLLYNQGQLNTRYDRAIFFFDSAGVLQDHAFSAPP